MCVYKKRKINIQFLASFFNSIRKGVREVQMKFKRIKKVVSMHFNSHRSKENKIGLRLIHHAESVV